MSMLETLQRKLSPSFAWYDVREFFRKPFAPGAKITARKLLNLYTVRFQRMRSHEKLLGYPLVLTIEAANVCNLACPYCFTGAGDVSRTKAHFPLPLYKQLMDELGPYLFTVELHNWGEPLLNKNIAEYVKIATDKGVGTLMSTNFSFPYTAERADTLVGAGLTQLGVSLDGATQETYVQYRRKGNLDLALANVRLINDAKKKLGSKTPRMIWEFHVFPWNEGDIEDAKRMAAELDMDIDISKGWVTGDEWGGRDNAYKFFQAPSVDGCEFLWQRAVVSIDGGVPPCCGTFFREDDFGTVSEKGFKAVWNNKNFRESRKLFKNRESSEHAKKLICYDCPATITRQEYLDHIAGGGKRFEFQGHFTSNDGFNYFFSHRPPSATPNGKSEVIALKPVDVAAPVDGQPQP